MKRVKKKNPTTTLPQKKAKAALRKLQELGITEAHLDVLPGVNSATLQPLVAAWPSTVSYSSTVMSRILDLPTKCTDLPPTTTMGGAVGYYDGQWDLRTLGSTPAAKKSEWKCSFFDWHKKRAKSGYYEILFLLPGSNNHTWEEMRNLLSDLKRKDAAWKQWQPCPLTVGASILLAHLAETGEDVLKGNSCRCADEHPSGHHFLLLASGVAIPWDDYDISSDKIWLAIARRT